MDVSRKLEKADLEVIDLRDGTLYAKRNLSAHDGSIQMEGVHRFARAMAQDPETIFQQLAEAAVELCGADSVGITVECEGEDGFYSSWVAVAGEDSPFLNASPPLFPIAHNLGLERGGPKLFRARKSPAGLLGRKAPTVRDGILLPWQVEELQGTIFLISHSSAEAFDNEDLHLLQILADFAAMGIKQRKQQFKLLAHARVGAAVAMADNLAHRINNPLQGLTNVLFLAGLSGGIGDEQSLALKLEANFKRLTVLVETLLNLRSCLAAGRDEEVVVPA